jgi:hypothetical protein
MTNPRQHGGLLEVPPGTPDNYVLLRDGSFAARESLRRADPRIELYGGGRAVMMATGQIVPITCIPE